MSTADLMVVDQSQWELVRRLDKDLKNSARRMGKGQARFLVDLYYQVQEYRIRAANQERMSSREPEPHDLVSWVFGSFETLENDIKRALGVFAQEYTVGKWLQALTGIGPVISAGLLAYLEIENRHTAGHFWSFAGILPQSKWLGKEGAKNLVNEVIPSRNGSISAEIFMEIGRRTGRNPLQLEKLAKGDKDKVTRDALISTLAKRPWNAKLKSLLAFKLGESFVKVQNKEADVYGKLYASRKKKEQEHNKRGDFSAQARQVLVEKNIGKDTDAYKWYNGNYPADILTDWEHLSTEQRQVKQKRVFVTDGSGVPMLPPAHIHARARRYAIRVFLSHLHHVMYEDWYQVAPPKPYILEKQPWLHTHYLAPPNWPMGFGERGKSLQEMGA